MLKHSQLLFMDEATALVDSQTDATSRRTRLLSSQVLIFLICIWTINLETRRCSISASSLSHINIRLRIIFGRTCDDEMKSWLMGVRLFFSLGRMG
ncbi:hypothetical protein L3X38_045312 [Prunus dulcis]|uniref:Uncharacterized protein n=1 Tax=Prunus dulcis TaxID=3755 RepID=A0AAD4V1R6_PRUDU|nr:hypothetical protein L3X38_045312 [Prunus dulcis]